MNLTFDIHLTSLTQLNVSTNFKTLGYNDFQRIKSFHSF